MNMPTYQRIPAPSWSSERTRYRVIYEEVDIGTVGRGRHSGVGGPGARHRHESWSHTCWSVEAPGFWGNCWNNRTQAARALARHVLGRGYGDPDPF